MINRMIIKKKSFFAEMPPEKILATPARLHELSRRDVLLFGAGALMTMAGAGLLLPQNTLTRLGVRRNLDSPEIGRAHV